MRGGILDAARYGVWSYCHGAPMRRGQGESGLFWDMYRGKSVSTCRIAIDGPSPRGRQVIYQSVGNLIPWSYAKNVYYHYYYKSTSFVPRRLKLLAEQGFPAIEKLSGDGRMPNARPHPHQPGDAGFSAAPCGLAGRQSRSSLFLGEQWFLVVNPGPRLAPSGKFTTGENTSPRPARSVLGRSGFLVVVDGQVWVFFENYSFGSKKAVISCAPVSADGALGDVSTALECSYHLSYPFILEHQGDLYMVPDTWAEKRVELWRCRKFPDDWVMERVLLDGLMMSDPTIHPQDGKLWLFGTVSEAREWANDELHLYMADALDGVWRPHPANPVVSDSRRARPAGRLFFRDGHLIRPAQDCSKNYGWAVVLNRVDELSEGAYTETPIGRIDGSYLPGNRGTHTLNYAGGLEFLDGRTMGRKGSWGPRGEIVPKLLR